MCVGLLCTYHIIPIQLSRRARTHTHTRCTRVRVCARVYVCVHGYICVCTGVCVFIYDAYAKTRTAALINHHQESSSLVNLLLKKKSFLKTRTAALITHHQESRLINFQFSRRHAAQKKMGIEIIPHSCSS